jgi:hypothetical protein
MQDKGGSLELVFKQDQVDFGEAWDESENRPRYYSFGYDLDARCTGQGEGPSCKGFSSDPRDPANSDGLDGRDNGMGRLVWRLAEENHLSPTELVNNALGFGVGAALLRVRNYKGEPDDDQVEVAVYAGGGFDNLDGQLTGAQHNKEDHWIVADKWVVPGTDDVHEPRYVDREAYVSDGMLVAHFDELLLGNPAAELQINYNVILTGRLKYSNGEWTLREGTLAGFVRMSDAFAWLGTFTDTRRNPFCRDSPGYARAKELLCSSVDIASSTNDSELPNCDAVATGMRFGATQAQLGKVKPFPSLASLCPEPERDPRNDSCP